MEEGKKEREKCWRRRRRGERIKGNGRKEKEGKALLLSLSRLKSRISLTWEPNLRKPPPPPPPHFPYGHPHLEYKLIDHCYRTYCANSANTQTHALHKSLKCTQHWSS